MASYSRLRIHQSPSVQHIIPSNIRELASKRKPLELSTSKPAAVAALAVVLYTLLGTCIFHYSSMQLNWTSAFYFAVTTTTCAAGRLRARARALSCAGPP